MSGSRVEVKQKIEEVTYRWYGRMLFESTDGFFEAGLKALREGGI